MGRLRKALSITSAIATGGAFGTPVRWESCQESAAKENAKLLAEQNDLLAEIAQNGRGSALRLPPTPRRAVPGAAYEIELKVCLPCLNQGCDQALGGDVGFTRYMSRCDCALHHEHPPA